MSDPALSARQLELAEASAEVATRSRAAAAARGQAPWAAGDRVLAHPTRHLPVEWVLLEAHAERPSFLAVPADTCPLLGEGDVAVPAGSAAGILSLRCRFAAWLDATQIGRRAGMIDRVTLEAARQSVRSVPSATVSGGGAVTETSPEYRAWIREMIAPARAAVAPLAVPPRHEPRAAQGWQRWGGRVAAALALVLGGALLGWWARPEPASQVAPASREPAPHVPITLTLYPLDPQRGGGEPAQLIPPWASHLVVKLSLAGLDKPRYPSYRVALSRQECAAPLWQSDELKAYDQHLSVELPRGLFQSSGLYRLCVTGLRGPRADFLAEYDLPLGRTTGESK